MCEALALEAWGSEEGLRWHGAAVFGQRGPLCVLSTPGAGAKAFWAAFQEQQTSPAFSR